MANPIAPQEGSVNARRLPYLIDPDNPGVAYLPVGSGALDMGAGRTPGAVPGALGWGIGSDGIPLQHHAIDTFVPFDLGAVTTEQLAWAPTTGRAVRLLAVLILSSVATIVDVIDGTGGVPILTIPLAAGVPFYLPLGDVGIPSAVANNGIYLVSSASADLAGTLMGCEDSVGGS
jgi:hypothetical protein